MYVLADKLARISHRIDEPKHMDVLNVVLAGCTNTTSIALCFHTKFYSIGQISRIADLHG